jgi:hypothetical protein
MKNVQLLNNKPSSGLTLDEIKFEQHWEVTQTNTLVRLSFDCVGVKSPRGLRAEHCICIANLT